MSDESNEGTIRLGMLTGEVKGKCKEKVGEI
jgi:hypothetical protein